MFIFEDNLAEQKNYSVGTKQRLTIAAQYAADGWHANTMPVVS